MKISSINVGVRKLQPSFKNNGAQQPKTVANSSNDVLKNDLENKALLAILTLAGFENVEAKKLSVQDVSNAFTKIVNGEAPIQQKVAQNSESIKDIQRFQTNPTVTKYAHEWNDLLLLTQNNVINRNANKYANALKTIETIAKEKLTSTKPLPQIMKSAPVVWSITSEYAPIKEGGLGSVPPEVRNNAEKLGVNMPTFVPLYLNEGVSTLADDNGSITYQFKGKQIQLEKVATAKIDTYKNGIPKTIPVTYYLNTDKNNNGQLVFVKADDYFEGSIYEANAKTEEPEKFAVFSKAVYEFAKMKMDGIKASKDVVIHNNTAYENIKTPDAMILNDWQASPTAALLRYKAVMENAHGQLSDDATKKLKNMSVITLGHNCMYQGATQRHNDYIQRKAITSNILNTLFDKYTYDIVTHAKSGAEEITPNNPENKKMENVLVLNAQDAVDNHTNFFNMGVILSDYFNPVSKNYAKELITPGREDLSKSLQWPLIQKARAGKLVGVINGNDFKGLNIQAKNAEIKKLTGVEFETYSQNEDLNSVLEKREHNKVNLYQNYILPFSESSACSESQIKSVSKINERLEFCKCARGTQLPVLNKEELLNTPILMSGGRLVKQKGMDILCDAMKILYENWDKDFPGRNKPILYIGGADGENGAQRKIIEDFKNNKLSKEDSDRVLFAHGWTPMAAMTAGADYFLMPSNFEPCGLTQGEALALGTPVVASAVGGIVDTINRNGKFNGFLTDKNKRIDAQGYYEALKASLETFFDNKDKYNKMVSDSLHEDFSWAKSGKEGPVYDYLDILGIKREDLPDVVEKVVYR